MRVRFQLRHLNRWSSRHSARRTRAMRIATFNINGIKARLPRLLEWLEETRPTVACLQEIKTQDAGFPADAFEKIGYHAIWHGQKGFNGVAILADGVKPVETQRGLPILSPRRRGGRSFALSGSGCERRARRIDLLAQRQPAARTEIRLQDPLDETPARPNANIVGTGSASRDGGRLQRHSPRSRCVATITHGAGRADAAAIARRLFPPVGRWLDRCVGHALPATGAFGPIGIIRPAHGNAITAFASITCCYPQASPIA